VRVPALIIHRRNDPVYGMEHARALAEGIPAARLVELPGTDHFLYSGDTEPILDAVRSFMVGAASPPTPVDRFLTTVLAAEVAGVQTSHAEPAQALVAVIRPCVEANRGQVVGFTGAGFLSTFDGPGRAVRAAADLRAALAPLGVEVRTGVHTAEVERQGRNLIGTGVDIASSLARAARPGSILVTRTVTDLVAGCGLAFMPHHEHPDGVPQPPFEALV
jgi:class 3 adenylate cyclase